MKIQRHYLQGIGELLRRNISMGQMLGYAVANVVGLSVILAGVLFSFDCQTSTAPNDRFFSADYVVLSKKVEGVGFTPVCFSEEDIEKLNVQKWVLKIGRFTASDFAVKGAVDIGGRGLSSDLFFESVPDDFFDSLPTDWDFDPQERFVPIMLSKEYLTLYNFGFAAPQGLPQISEKMAGAIPITLYIAGQDNRQETFDAAIVGFSSRLNTIAVPQHFMDWANARFSVGEEKKPSRLIVKVDRLAAADMEQYLQREELEMARDGEALNNVGRYLRIVSGVIATNGVVISLLALFILALSIFLLLQKNKEILKKLMWLGYSPQDISRYYEFLVLAINLIVTVTAFFIAVCCRLLWRGLLVKIGLGGASLWPILYLSVMFFLLIGTANIGLIRRNIARIWSE